jgi:hypothetical protein
MQKETEPAAWNRRLAPGLTVNIGAGERSRKWTERESPCTEDVYHDERGPRQSSESGVP